MFNLYHVEQFMIALNEQQDSSETNLEIYTWGMKAILVLQHFVQRAALE